MSTTTERVWHELGKASFAVVSCVTATGEPRSSGVVYTIDGHTMYVAVAEDSWKARHIAANPKVAVTVPVRRGGILSMLFPIPPATISFHGSATVQPGTSLREGSAPPNLARLLPVERRDASSIIQIQPEGAFLTYGVGVALVQLRIPSLARQRVPVMTESAGR